jgi:hypothetical protein
MSHIGDLKPFNGILPYASELYGVYQPLLGWKSQRSISRFQSGFQFYRTDRLSKAFDQFKAADIKWGSTDGPKHINVDPMVPAQFVPSGSALFGSTLLQGVRNSLPKDYDVHVWDQLTPELITSILNESVKKKAINDFQTCFDQQASHPHTTAFDPAKYCGNIMVQNLSQQCVIGGLLLELKNCQSFSDLKYIIYDSVNWINLCSLVGPGIFDNPLDTIDPHKDLDRVGLSPIGIVHLFREYFFEFDTFLGSPAGHVWLSPGGTVELVEVLARRQLNKAWRHLSRRLVRRKRPRLLKTN